MTPQGEDQPLPSVGGRRRIAWGLADQVAASGANFLVVILAARSLALSDFGVFVVGMTLCAVCLVLNRGLTSDLVATKHSADSTEDLHYSQRAALSAALMIAGAAATIAIAVASATDGEARDVALAVALIVPGVLVQDCLRVCLIVSRRARAAFFNDAAWGVLEVPALIGASWSGGGAAVLLIAWGAIGTLCAVAAAVQLRLLPLGLRSTWGWLRGHRRLWPYLLLDNAVAQSANAGTLLVVTIASNVAQVGALRVAATVYAPLLVLGRGAATVAVPELVRRNSNPRQIRRISGLLGCSLAAATAAWAVGTLAVPQSTGTALFGETWIAARPLLALMAIGVAGAMFSFGVVVGLRSLAAGSHGLLARIIVTTLLLLACFVGAREDGARGAVLLLALVAPLQVAAWWLLLLRATQSAGSNLPGTSSARTSAPPPSLP